ACAPVHMANTAAATKLSLNDFSMTVLLGRFGTYHTHTLSSSFELGSGGSKGNLGGRRVGDVVAVSGLERNDKIAPSGHLTRRLHMTASSMKPNDCRVGSPDLRLPDELRAPLLDHLKDLRDKYLRRGWGGRVGFGSRPALVVIDLARFWLDAQKQIGSHLD